jgi:hypothetical protein
MKIEVDQSTSLDTVPIDDEGFSDFPKRVKAAQIYGWEPDPRLEALSLGDGTLVFWAPPGVDGKGRRKPTVVNQDLFGDLACVDATRVRISQTYDVGQAMPYALQSGPWKIAEVLIRGGVIRPFVHIGASICLTDQFATPAEWIGTYQGTHTFFTNEKNVSAVAFKVHVETAGRIFVEGM